LVRALPPVIVLPLDRVDALTPSLDLLFGEIDNVRCGQRILADRLFEVVLIQLFRWIIEHSDELKLPAGLMPGLSDERLAPTLIAIHESPGQPWTLTTMARTTGMSRSSFAATFKATVGQPPADYLTDWRLTVAQDQLRRGVSVAATATALGYTNPSAFSRVFSQRLGQPPRTWLNNTRA
jgi:AraC-like DNA-binding protein